MKHPKNKHWFRAALAGLMLAGAVGSSQSQTFITTSYTNTFDTGGATANFAGSGSVASWIYWYSAPGNNSAITNNIAFDAGNNASSGSLEIVTPFTSAGNQNLFFGTFGNGYGYDFSTRANFLLYSNITFDLRMAPGTTPRQVNGTNVDFGVINVGIINGGYGYQQFGTVTIPLAASNSWVHMAVNVDITQNNLANVPGICFNINNYSDGYPTNTITNYIDNVKLNLNPGPPPPAPKLALLPSPTPGLNTIATGGGQYDRHQIITTNDLGYTFVGQPSVTYSFNIASFPTNTGGNYQAHFFIVNGAPGQYDQAADYNLAQCIFMTVQQSDAGVATFNFRYKTNEDHGNAMFFNTNLPSDTVNNPNGWPAMPIANLTNTVGAVGTWTVTFANNTNVTVHGPGGVVTNFTWDAASAALFADPATLILGSQPNNVNGFGQAVVYTSFSATGCGTPISDNFAADSTLNTAIWKNLGNDTNGAIVVPSTTAYVVKISLPDAGYSLQTKSTATSGSWTSLASVPVIRSLSVGSTNLSDLAFIDKSVLPSTNSGFFRMFQPTFTQLQVLLPGETAAPNTATGKTGTPSAVPVGSVLTVTVNAVDQNFNVINSATDTIDITTTDGGALTPNDAALVNGTMQFFVLMGNTPGTYTVTATDTTDATKTAGVSTPFATQ